MTNADIGRIACSLKGHDRGELYLVLQADEAFVYVSDGRLKPADDPKKKNRKHVRLENSVTGDVQKRLQSGQSVRDEEIRSFLKEEKKRRQFSKGNKADEECE